MNTYTKIRPAQFIGPYSQYLTFESLPPAGTRRWVARRKAEVLAAIVGGMLSIEEACQRYDLSVEELMLWQRAVERSGVPGLRVKQIQSAKALLERQASIRPAKVPAAVADVALTDRGGTESQVPAHALATHLY